MIKWRIENSPALSEPSLSPFVLFRMFLMLITVIHTNFCQFLRLDDQQILRILFLSSFREVERSGYYRFLVNDHDLVVGGRTKLI